jgi:hypothetical protein
MTNKCRIVVSVENTPYLAWQSKLFHFSCVTRLGLQPVFIVHETGRPWHPDFIDLVRAGAIVRKAPSYITENGLPTRNSAGTLLHAAPLCNADDFIVLCDPDMIFARRPEFSWKLSGNYYSYLDYEQPHIHAVAEKLGIPSGALRERQNELCGGVPYVIPANEATRLAEAWLNAFDHFSSRGRDWDHAWLDIMYAFGLAVTKLALTLTLTDIVSTNYTPGEMLDHEVIHYCYGDTQWDKRRYLSYDDAQKVWDPPFQPAEGTVARELFAQIRQACSFYRDPYFGGGNGHGFGPGAPRLKSI